jgi:4-hydroxy-tetrahydrodipicolinate reductase
MRIALIGVGRLGREIQALAPERDAVVVATFGRNARVSADALRSSGANIAIDVSVAEAVAGNVESSLAAGLPMVVGVTGWQDGIEAVVRRVTAVGGGILIAPNFSIGAVLFSVAVADAARRFSKAVGFDAALIESHHALKRDAPSGTARQLAAVAIRARGADVPVTSVRVGPGHTRSSSTRRSNR